MESDVSAPRFSVLLPTHNQVGLLQLAIESVLNQTVSDLELLIVADGCTDGTQEVVRGFRDPRIRLFDLPKAPAFGYANRNIALDEARGELIAFQAHDDLWLHDHLELMGRCFEQPEVEIAHSRPAFAEPDGRVYPVNFNLTIPTILEAFLAKRRSALPMANVVHRRECLRKYGGWNAELEREADWDLWNRIIEGGERRNLAFVDQPTTLHFRALWRSELRDSIRGGMRDVESSGGPQPLSAIRLAVPEGVSEQSVVWDAMRQDPGGWARSLREQTPLLLEEGAFLFNDRCGTLQEQLAETLRDLERARRRAKTTREKLAASREKNRKLKQKLKQMKQRKRGMLYRLGLRMKRRGGDPNAT